MLSADRDNGTGRVLASDLDDRRRRDGFHCPECGDAVIPKLGREVVEHFAHIPNERRACSGENESPAHLRAKLALFELFRANGYDVDVECRVATSRRLDLRVASPHRWCAVEIQTSRIAVPEMKRRMRADRAAGAVDTVWVWVNRWRPPEPNADEGHVELPDDVRYLYHLTWSSLNVMRYGRPWLALASRVPRVAITDEVRATVRELLADGRRREAIAVIESAGNDNAGGYYRRTFDVAYAESAGALVVCRDRFQHPRVRFRAVEQMHNARLYRESVAEPWPTVADTWTAAL